MMSNALGKAKRIGEPETLKAHSQQKKKKQGDEKKGEDALKK